MVESNIEFDDIAEADELLRAVEADQPRASAKFVCTSLAEVAAFFGMHVQTVKGWRTETPPMPGVEGCYPLNDVVRWRLAKLQNSSQTDEQKVAKLEQTRLKNAVIELELAQTRDELISRFEVTNVVSTAMARFRNRLTATGTRVAILVPADCKASVKSQVDDLMNTIIGELHHDLVSLSAERKGDDSDQ